MKSTIFAIAGCLLMTAAVAQTGQLTKQQQQAQLIYQTLMRSRSCSSNSHKCQAACEANNQLQEAADDLKICTETKDLSDSCDRSFNDVRDAHDELETAVSEAGGDCD